MLIENLKINDVKLIKPNVFSDERGFFYESYNHKMFEEAIGYKNTFVQDNHSKSSFGVLRGLHYQIKHAQGKLIRVVKGEVLDVAVDLRKSSPTYSQWVSTILSEDNKNMLWIPEGFAHGFLVLSNNAELLYKTTDYYYPEYERCIKWDDEELDIKWNFNSFPVLSEKDQKGIAFKLAETYD